MGFELLHGPLTSLISLGFTHKITRTIESTCCYLSFPNRLAHFSLALDQINHSLKNIGKERNERFSLKKAAEYVHGLIKDAYEKFIFYKFLSQKHKVFICFIYAFKTIVLLYSNLIRYAQTFYKKIFTNFFMKEKVNELFLFL